ncbi:hypothetical protein [Methylicorpusculum sp.]|uniref:hypothetical protein n=1 Tax=Methylicorpusculum sp. TaxID=2713644 RepID=UPI0027208983|nr:hypothetical protein [Methylicorpusculum sp.]MDO8845576.1 hypothetical protein [Methylicorpusculum sp.]
MANFNLFGSFEFNPSTSKVDIDVLVVHYTNPAHWSNVQEPSSRLIFHFRVLGNNSHFRKSNGDIDVDAMANEFEEHLKRNFLKVAQN